MKTQQANLFNLVNFQHLLLNNIDIFQAINMWTQEN